MSFSLSSLLNPTPDAQDRTETGRDDAVEHTQSQSPTLTRDSLPANNSLPSPELLQAQLPKYTPPQRSNASLIATRGNSEAQPIKDDRAPDQTTTSAREDHGSVHDTSTLSQATSLQSKMLVTGQPVPTILTTESLTQPENERDVVMKEDGKREDDRSTINRPPASHMDTHLGPISASTEVQGEQEPVIKQEARSPLEIPADQQSLSTQAVDDAQASKTITSLKHEYASRTQSPLRESSVALPTTEDTLSNTTTTKKRAGPAKAKKGTATIARKTKPTIKKRKVDIFKTAPKNGKDASSPTPSDSQSMQADDDDDESMVDSDEDVEGSGGVYCICRKPDNGTFMIGCDGKCDDWFHGKCVSIEERDKNLIDKYICPRCAEAGVGRTSWKRMCRRESCRQPARVGRNAGKDGATSKYCSDECGVLFFRQMTASARGNDELKRDRGGRRKSGHGTKADEARGGILNAGEIRAMLDQTDNAAEFRELGNGVLSPPATPSADVDTGEDLTEQDHTALNAIATQKDQARQRHQSLKDRLKFISLVKLEATRAAVEKELKPKDYCGFDSRLEWTEEEFAAWRQTPQGQQVFEIESLEPKADAVANEGEDVEVCTRKKCARHADWSKLAVDDVRFEMTDNSDRMRTLEQDEQDLRDRAMLRAKARKLNNDETRVELHADDMSNGVNGTMPSQSEAMDIDHAV